MKKILAVLLALLGTSALAQNYLRDDGIFHSVVEGTTNGQVLVNSAGQLAGSTGVPVTVGSTPITGGSNSKTLYDNAGFVGEYQPNVPIAGAVCDGTTDDTAAIQAAWTLAAARGVNVWLGGVGTGVCKFSQLVAPTPTGMGKGSFLVGPGASITKLLSTATGTNCAITIAVTYGVNAYLNGAFQGFTLERSALNQTGYGICMSGVAQTTFRDVTIQYFDIGFKATDNILVSMLEGRLYQNNIGISAAFGSFSAPNGWTISDYHFVGNKKNAVSVSAPALFNILRSEFESNGSNAGANPATVDIIGPSSAGASVGLNLENSYFEANEGVEVRIQQAASAISAIHSIKNNTFGRSLTTLTTGVLIVNDGTGISTVNVEGNGFTDGTGISAGFAWLKAQTPATLNYTFNCALVNRVDVAAEMPVACRNSAANSVMLSDSNNQYIGLSTTGNFSAGTITAALSGTATNATNITITDDTTTNATVYPTWVAANTGNLPQRVTSTRMTFNPLAGNFAVTGNVGASTFNNVGISTGGSTAAISLASGKLFSISNTLTLAGTDGSTLNIGAGGTLGSNAFISTAYAPLASPALTGTPTAPTAGAGTNTTQLATTAFVTTADLLKVQAVKKQVFTASGTYTPSTGILYAVVECVGAGGGAGGASGSVGGIFSGAGGGAGGYSRVVLTAAAIGASKSVTIGAAGAGGAAGSNNGAAGGDTCVGGAACTTNLCAGKGGSGGLFGSVAQVPTAGSGGVAGTGDLTAAGSPGLPGFYSSITSTAFPSGNGGSSFFGGGAVGVTANAAANPGNAGGNYGAGGSGASAGNTASTAAGGNGSAGVVFITEYTNQ